MHHHPTQTETTNIAPQKMTTFTIVWLGQLVSLLGSSMTSFALSLWVYQQSGSVTLFALINVFAVIPSILLSPFAGILADRMDRRKLMILSDSLAGVTTLGIAALFYTGNIAVWHIYISAVLIGTANTFQWPAFMAAVTQLVPKEKLGRANGMLQLNQAGGEIFAPLIAGALIVSVGVYGVLLVDVISFSIGVLVLLPLKFPQLATRATPAQGETKKNLWREASAGFTYIRARRGLAGLVTFNAVISFLRGMVGASLVPLILGFTSEDRLGQIITIAGLGMLTGSLVMSAWGGPKRKIYAALGFEVLSGFCIMLIGFKPLAWLVAAGAFGAHVTIAIVSGSAQAIWQVKVPAEMQGRVFGAVQMLSRSLTPLAFVVAGLLADHVFGPLLMPGGAGVAAFGDLVGVGAGRGIGLMYLVMGVIRVIVSLGALANPRIRRVELDLPDAI